MNKYIPIASLIMFIGGGRVFAQAQLGSDIDGEASNDRSGYSVSMNSAGDRVAIGAHYNDGGPGSNGGHVRIYEYSSGWSQLGSDIDGEAASDWSGYSVSMNSAGDRVAIGAPEHDSEDKGQVRIYQYDGSSWSQLGSDIDGEAANDESGISVSMNSDGDRVAIGAPYNDGTATSAGHVRVYEYSNSSWTKLGSDIDGEAANDRSGVSVSINSAGDRVAIGAYQNDGTASGAGHVRVYERDASNTTIAPFGWSQLGSDIDGEAGNDWSGWSVSMNSAGDRVAIGAYGNGLIDPGHVRIYEYSSSWSQLGSDIDGEFAVDYSPDYSGYSVSMNSDGDRVAIGAHLNDGTTGSSSDNRGHVRVYERDASNTTIAPFGWSQLGSDIDGEAGNDWSGYSVSMNSAGDRVAIGAYYNDGGPGSNGGHVRIYEYSSGSDSWTKLGSDIDGEAAGDFSGYSVSMNSAGDRVAIGAYNNDGTTGSSSDNRGHVRVIEIGSVTISGNSGFRMMSSPVAGQIYGDLLDELWTQGMTGADADYTGNDNANVWTYSGTSWTALTDISSSGKHLQIYLQVVTASLPGRGFWYMCMLIQIIAVMMICRLP